LKKYKSDPFLLYVGFHDSHRCGRTHPKFGQFCEKFGNGDKGMGLIPDWTPVKYSYKDVPGNYFIPNTHIAREEIAAQYQTISRLDQGVGLILSELEKAGVSNDTLVIFTSDNGIPFPCGKTNMYAPGMSVPLLISSPSVQRNQNTSKLVSLLDLFPTILDWFDIEFKNYVLNGKVVKLTGSSLLPLINGTMNQYQGDDVAYGSHSFHEITMYYPMRVVRTDQYKLIRNLNHLMPFSIDQDLYVSPSFLDVLNRSQHGHTLNWYKTLDQYYYRGRGEFYNLALDPAEMSDAFEDKRYQDVIHSLSAMLTNWMNITNDPWICSPGSVLEDKGDFANKPSCLPMYNNISNNIIF